jgi:hypothetical protein
MGGVLLLIWVNREEDYFHGKGWTDFWVICPSGKSGEQSDLPYLQCGLPSEPFLTSDQPLPTSCQSAKRRLLHLRLDSAVGIVEDRERILETNWRCRQTF